MARGLVPWGHGGPMRPQQHERADRAQAGHDRRDQHGDGEHGHGRLADAGENVKPSPNPTRTSGNHKPAYVVSTATRDSRKQPAAMSTMPVAIVRRAPKRPRMRPEASESRNMARFNGNTANAAGIGDR